jgi:hypothetical protein
MRARSFSGDAGASPGHPLVEGGAIARAVATPDSSFRYMAFLEHAFNSSNGRFRNFLGYDRRWNEAVGSEDCHGRALWALGTVLGRSKDEGLRCAAGRLFEFSCSAVMEFTSPRAWAYTLLGIQEYLNSYPGDRDAQKVRSALQTIARNVLFDSKTRLEVV